VYFTSKVLHGAEERYPRIKKLAYALVISARRLRPYFQEHVVRVLTEYPLRKILQKPDLSGRLVNWAIELGQYDIEYHPRTAVKGQALANFVVEMNETPNAEELPKGSTWIVYVDGSSAGGRCGAGIAFWGPNREEFRYALKFGFATRNNEAEYEAVLSAMEIAWEMGIMNLEVRSDSRVVVEQVNGSYTAQEARMSRYLDKVRQFYLYFDKVVLTKVPREENGLADALSRIGSGTDSAVTVGGCKILVKARPAISSEAEVMQLNEAEPEWGAEIVRYLKMGELPPGKTEAQKVIRNSARYVLVGGILYRHGYSLPLLKCLSGEDASYVLKEVHHGVCGNHSGAKALANKIIRAGYYWPTMIRDAKEMVRACDACQRFTRVSNSPPEYLHSVTSPWPFAKWGIDIVGPMPPGKGNRKFIVVVVDYFTKWAEAEALAAITTENVIKFLWKSVICRFGIPYAMVTDNGKQFDCDRFREWCAELGIRKSFSTPVFPNKTLIQMLKKKLGRKKGAWVEYLPEGLWSYRTTVKTATGETPFALAYGIEAVIPVEVGSPSFRVAHYNPGLNEEGINLHLDLLQERREDANAACAAYQGRVANYYNKKVKPRAFSVGDWVLRKVNLMTKEPTDGKLGPKWEGPYRIVSSSKNGAYRLATRQGKTVPRAWNADHLKKYYF
jgi:ribonuclease HI